MPTLRTQVLADPGVVVVVVVPIVAVHGAQVPSGKVVMDGVPVLPARRLPIVLREPPAVLGPERVVSLANPSAAIVAATSRWRGNVAARDPSGMQ